MASRASLEFALPRFRCCWNKAQIEQEKLLFGSDYKRNNLVFLTPSGDFTTPGSITGRIREFMQEAGVRLHSTR
jgi:hypothetical protein